MPGLLVRSTGFMRQLVEDTEQSGDTAANCAAAAGWVGLGVIADNVVNIGRAMAKRATP